MLINVFFVALTTIQPPADTGRTASGLWYSGTGTGPPVVLLHGSNLDSRSWGSLPGALSANHRVIRTDLRSHGRSRDASGPFSWADDVVEVLDAVGADRATLIGHSLGAQIAIDVAVSRPSRVNGLIVIGPAISGMPLTKPPAGIEDMVAALRRGDLVTAGAALGRMPVMTLYRDTASQNEVRTIVAENVRLFRADRAWLTPLDPPAAGRVGELSMPVLVLLGEVDPTESNAAGRALLERVPGAASETIPGCGHLVPLDCPVETARAVAEFLRQAGR